MTENDFKHIRDSLASILADIIEEGLWQASVFASFKVLYKIFKSSADFLNKFFRKGYSSAHIPPGWAVFFGVLCGFIFFIVNTIIHRIKYGKWPWNDPHNPNAFKEICTRAAFAIVDTCASILFWEAGYSLGALVLIPLLLTPLGLSGFIATIIVCTITTGLGTAIWSFIKYAAECHWLKTKIFSWMQAANACKYGFLMGANFTAWSALFFLIPIVKPALKIVLEVGASVLTSIFAGFISFSRERTLSNTQTMELAETGEDLDQANSHTKIGNILKSSSVSSSDGNIPASAPNNDKDLGSNGNSFFPSSRNVESPQSELTSPHDNCTQSIASVSLPLPGEG